MVDLISGIARNTPKFLKSQLKNTQIEDFYSRIRLHTAELKPVVIETPTGQITLNIPTGSPFFEKATEKNTSEPGLMSEFSRLASEDDVFYDVGARFGYTSLALNDIGVSAENVHAFEANLFRYNILCQNCEGTEINTVHGLVGHKENPKCLSVDEYTARNTRPDVVKIDVEGAEYSVLQGAKETLNRDCPDVYVEIHPDLMSDFNAYPKDVFELLRACGYSLEVADHRVENPSWRTIETPTSEMEIETVLPSVETFLVKATAENKEQ